MMHKVQMLPLNRLVSERSQGSPENFVIGDQNYKEIEALILKVQTCLENIVEGQQDTPRPFLEHQEISKTDLDQYTGDSSRSSATSGKMTENSSPDSDVSFNKKKLNQSPFDVNG